jgi:hypothetical protein
MDENQTIEDNTTVKTEETSQLSIAIPIIVFSTIGTILLTFGILHGSVRLKR